MPHPDLDAEQSYVDDAYRCLAAMRERTRRASESADNAAQAVDSAIAHAHLAHRLGSLDDDVPGLSFGRLDGDGGDTWYVGRRHVVARIAADLADRYTSVAVVAIEPLRSSVGDLAASVLAPPDAKGLEFDAVVVVEPDAIAAGTSRGLRLLYVALTRAVQELVIVHARPLPPALVREPARWRTSPRWGARRRGT